MNRFVKQPLPVSETQSNKKISPPSVLVATEEMVSLGKFLRETQLTERMSDSVNPQEAEYWRGYRHGRGCRVFHQEGSRCPMHVFYLELPDGNPHLDAYARGYRDGFTE